MILGWTTVVPLGKLAERWRARAEDIADLDETAWRTLRDCADELTESLRQASQGLGITINLIGGR
ncbi:hypothetical protein CH276_14160 [Rhodococcus sp. 06-470-2]|nr:hypothetical protein CH276_14160 [Rhodococcus sp. 06-470-2]OZE71737.1 hypothetical protein CH265_01640 [Rhodococcus sp. 05-2221-1B]